MKRTKEQLEQLAEVKGLRISALAGGIGGYCAKSLDVALSLFGELKGVKDDYGMSNKNLIALLKSDCQTINEGDIKDLLDVGRAVNVAKSFGLDLVSAQVSLTSAKAIGKKIDGMMEKKDSDGIKAVFAAAIAGSDVKALLPKREGKAKAEGEGKADVETRPATADEMASALLSRLAEVSEPVKVALLKALSASLKASGKASLKASEPVAIPETMKATG